MKTPASTGSSGHWKAALVAAVLAALPAVTPAAVLQTDRQLSTDGVVQLSWALDGRPVELQRATDAAFTTPRTLYRGTDSASLRTGLADGDYYFRLRPGAATSGAWSAPVMVSVRHHGAARTWGLFGLGGVVFLSVLAVILWGRAREVRHG